MAAQADGVGVVTLPREPGQEMLVPAPCGAEGAMHEEQRRFPGVPLRRPVDELQPRRSCKNAASRSSISPETTPRHFDQKAGSEASSWKGASSCLSRKVPRVGSNPEYFPP